MPLVLVLALALEAGRQQPLSVLHPGRLAEAVGLFVDKNETKVSQPAPRHLAAQPPQAIEAFLEEELELVQRQIESDDHVHEKEQEIQEWLDAQVSLVHIPFAKQLPAGEDARAAAEACSKRCAWVGAW